MIKYLQFQQFHPVVLVWTLSWSTVRERTLIYISLPVYSTIVERPKSGGGISQKSFCPPELRPQSAQIHQPNNEGATVNSGSPGGEEFQRGGADSP